ncbi:MAG: cysteine desulfurase NifS [Clostridia bacterium]|nr:cysteine desulfurase NifS [Clostridia bacterium]
MKPIYLDHAATTPLDKRVLEKMLPYFTENYGNANSQHSFGQTAKVAVDNARKTIADIIGAKPSEIYFTSGGTESDNWALRGTAKRYKDKGKHLIISKIEHHAMLTTAKELEKEGFEFSYIGVDEYGSINLDELEKAIRPDTIFIGCMYANNEVGTIQPIEKIVEIAKKHNIVCFTDAVQAMGAIEINVSKLGVDMMSFSAHKFGGPKGVGALYIRNGLDLGKIITGGHQERTRRGGTTNVAGVVGFSEALRLSRESLDKDNEYIKGLRDRFIERVESEIPYVKLNGSRENRLSNNADFSFYFIEGESILMMLDLEGIAVSSGSACSSDSLDPSHVLLAMGIPAEYAHGSIRFTFGKDNTLEEVEYTVDKLKEIIHKLREMSPLFKLNSEVKNV